MHTKFQIVIIFKRCQKTRWKCNKNPFLQALHKVGGKIYTIAEI